MVYMKYRLAIVVKLKQVGRRRLSNARFQSQLPSGGGVDEL